MSVRTGKGDSGSSGLIGRRGIMKDSEEFLAIGDLDELNAYLGLIRTRLSSKKDRVLIERMHRTIVNISAFIAALGKDGSGGEDIGDVKWLEDVLKVFERNIKPAKSFYVPGKNELSAFIDITRTVARRAERSVVGLFRKKKIKCPNTLKFLNCISDVLFVMAVGKNNK